MPSRTGQTPARPPRNSWIGLVLMLTATAAFVAMTAFVKLLREDGLSTPQVMFWRMAPGLPWVLVELRLRGIRLVPRVPSLIVTRCLFGLCSMATNFYAVRALTLVQHNVLHLLQPVFVAVLAPFVLRERLRGVAILALALALIGAAAVIDPTRASAEIPLVPALAGVTAALFSALAHMWVRRATEHDAPELLVFYFMVSVSLIAFAWGFRTDQPFLLPTTLGPVEAAWKIAAMAGFGLAGQLLMTRAYERTQAPAVAVVAYASIPLSFGLDVAAWGATGSLATLVGAALMFAAGILLVRGR